MNTKGKQHLTHMSHKLLTFTLKHDIVTIITGSSSQRYRYNPATGHGLKHSAQVHIYVEETKDRCFYNLIKHPQYPLRKEQEYRPDRKIMAITRLKLRNRSKYHKKSRNCAINVSVFPKIGIPIISNFSPIPVLCSEMAYIIRNDLLSTWFLHTSIEILVFQFS